MLRRCALGKFMLVALLSLAQNLLLAEEPVKPRLVLIGDSTVKNGNGRGDDGMYGWGQVLAKYFDQTRIELENRALGGRSSRTYLTEGLWERSLERLRPGDFVLMQFGHNDGGQMFDSDRPRASIKGNGDETVDGVVQSTGKSETVHSFGWYLRKYVTDAQAKGATPIVLSLIPRDRWEGDEGDRRVIRANEGYGLWAKQAAEASGAHFIDLNEIVSLRYEELGEYKVGRDFFTEDDWTHPTCAGAEVNAECVVQGIRSLADCELKDFLLPVGEQSKPRTHWKFDFGEGMVEDSYLQVLPSTEYSSENGFGWEPGAKIESVDESYSNALTNDACGSDAPFHFSVGLPPGNYRVTVRGGSEPLTVKAELRRLMIEQQAAQPQAARTLEFTVNVRDPELPNGESVRLKPREQESEAWAWDEKLTLEFNGDSPTVSSLEIEPEPNAPTVFLAGDSTVADQPLEPWNSWGQMLPRFFRPGIAIANHSESGESIRSSMGAGRFIKIFSLMRRGDYLFLQFGHNDQKDTSPDALKTYRKNLGHLVRFTKSLGATPVLVTSMERKPAPDRRSLGEYPQTVRDVAIEFEVSLIDLNSMSRELYAALGDDLDHAFQDGTHHTSYGSYLLAQCVIKKIRELDLDLADWIVADFSGFDPKSPPAFASFRIPASPRHDFAKPDGN